MKIGVRNHPFFLAQMNGGMRQQKLGYENIVVAGENDWTIFMDGQPRRGPIFRSRDTACF